jgi:hypothetical protein
MDFFWIILATIACVISGIGLCFWLLQKASDDSIAIWCLEHIACPIIRIIVLLIIVSLLYPSTGAESSMLGFWQVLLQYNHINETINILFFGSLLLSFLPILSHPVFTLPLQSCLSIALVFSWQYAPVLYEIPSSSPSLVPAIGAWIKIVLYMTAAYFITRHSSIVVARWIDQKMEVTGSIRLVSDSIYLVFQIPVILSYCVFLSQILASFSPIL